MREVSMLVPERWQDVIQLLLSPVAWVPRMQEALLAFFLNSAGPWVTAAKCVFLLLPALAEFLFDDENAIRTRYYTETIALLQKLTGASRVVVFDHTIRRRIPGATDRTTGIPRQPVPRVHNDYTVRSGPQRVRDLLGDEAGALLQKRFSVINVWRPIRGPVQDTPLAVSDARSIDDQDLVATDLVYPDRTGEIYYVKFNPAHKWFYAPAMRSDEVMLIKCYDSVADGRARFVPHSAFVDPTTPAGAPPRESIELRTLVFYD